MTARGKERLVVLALAAFAVWPVVHHVLAERVALNPWKLGAWSMYAVPHPRVEARLLVATPAGARPQPWPDDPLVRDELEAFTTYAEHLGALVTPDRLARALRRSARMREPFAIVVDHIELDPVSARLRARTRVHRYPRR